MLDNTLIYKSMHQIVDRNRKQSPTLFAFFFLVFIGLLVFAQHYVKYAHTNEFAPRLSFFYNLIIYASFAAFTPLIIRVSRRLPFDKHHKTKSVIVHLLISVVICFLHMLLCNVILYMVDLVSAIPFSPFIKKYLTGVVQIHFLVYWAIHGMVSLSIMQQHPQKKVPTNKFKVSMNNEQYYVEYDKINWIEAIDHYQKLHVENGCHIIKDSMKSLESKMPSNLFCRIHRSYFVNISKVKSVYRDREKGCYVKLNDELQLKVSASYRKQLMSVLQRHN